MHINGDFDLEEFLKIINPRSHRKPRPSPGFAKYQQILQKSRLKARSQTPTRPAVTELTEEDYKMAQQPLEYFLFQRYHKPERLPPYRPSGRALTQRFHQPHLGVPRVLPDKNNPKRAFLLLEPEPKKEENQDSRKPTSNDKLPLLSDRSYNNMTPERSRERITPTKLSLRQHIQTTPTDRGSRVQDNSNSNISPAEFSFHQDRPSPRFSSMVADNDTHKHAETERMLQNHHHHHHHDNSPDDKQFLIPVMEEKMKQELRGYYWKYQHHHYKASDSKHHCDHTDQGKNNDTYEKHLKKVLKNPTLWEEVNQSQSQEHKSEIYPHTERSLTQNEPRKVNPGGFSYRNRSYHKKNALSELILKKHQEEREEQDDKKLLNEVEIISARLKSRKRVPM